MDPAAAATALSLEYKANEPAYAAFTSPDGGRAWLVRGDNGPVGYIRGADGQQQTITNLDEWAAAAESAGMTTPEGGAEAGEPAPDTETPAEDAAEPEQTEEEFYADDAPAAVPDGPDEPPLFAGTPDNQPGTETPVEDAGDTAPESPVEDAAEPAVKAGAWATDGTSIGRVDLIVASGEVPGTDASVTGDTGPLARLVHADGTKSALPVAALTATQEPRVTPEVYALAEKANTAGVPLTAVQAAWVRAEKSYPGRYTAKVTPQQWATGRAERLIAAATDPRVRCNDRDLLG